MVAMGTDLIKREGVVALWGGVTPALVRGFVYGGLRLGLYSPIKASVKSMGGQEELSFGGKLAAGTLSGGLAAALTSPTELIKTRMQTQANPSSSSSVSRSKPTTIQILRSVVEKDGVKGLWKGSGPGMARASVITACQCASYEDLKRMVMRASGWGDNMVTHLTASTLAGLIATTITNPLDVIKTKVFVQGGLKTPMEAARELLVAEGVAGFMRGFTANFARLGPQTVIAFMVNEGLRDHVGMKAL
jgi:solute carrier family 25 uncoupling protein 8/9